MPSSQPAILNVNPGDWDEFQRQINYIIKDIYNLFDLVRGLDGKTSIVADVYGPASSIGSNLVEFDGASGKLLKDGGLTHAGVSDAVTKKHDRSHFITGTSDHDSTATPGKMLKADANGLPIDATNTDAQVAAAVGGTFANLLATAYAQLRYWEFSALGAGVGPTLTDADFGMTYILASAADTVYTLPSISMSHGGWFRFIRVGVGKLTIQAVDADTIEDGAAAGTIYCSGAGYAAITLMVTSETGWSIVGGAGTWVTSASSHVLSFNPATIAFTGGTIDGIPIGSTTPAQGIFTNEYLASPDVDHGMTSIADTHDYAALFKIGALIGGLDIYGLTDADQAGALRLTGVLGTDDPTDSSPAVIIRGGKKNGTGWQALAAAESVAYFYNYTTLLGQIYGNGEWLLSSLQNTPIGSTIASTGKFTTLAIKYVGVSDADRTNTALSTDCIVAFTALTAPHAYQISSEDIAQTGRIFVVKDESGQAGTHAITISTEGAETIDGAASISINSNYGSVTLYSDGSNLSTHNKYLPKEIDLPTSSELTIAAGVVTVSGTVGFRRHTIDTESDAATDDLTTINGGNAGEILIISAANDARTVVCKSGASLLLQADFSMDSINDMLMLECKAANVWREISRANNG